VEARPVRIGLLGCGNVGAALVELVRSRRADIAARLGLDLEVVRVAVRSATKERAVDVAPAELTTDALAVATAPDIDVVVEVIGGIEPARELILEALKAGKPVVTANKELLANHGAELFAAADTAQRDVLFEAAVAGGIPLMRPLRQSLAGEPIRRVMGIVNGTTNYILTRMTEEGASYHAALSEAQRLGYAERDPTADVEGFDAGAKAAIIAMVAFGVRVVAGDVYHEGIASITQSDIDVARRLGYRIKLLAVIERFDADDRPEVAVRVHPAMVPETHPLAAVRDSFNAVFVEGGAAGDLMFYGRGAGGTPTSSAVLGDVIDVATNLHRGVHASMGVLSRPRVRSIDDLQSAYYLSLDVVDRPGVLAAVATVFGTHGVSIRSMEQIGLADEARLIFITHSANERDFRATLRDLRGLEAVRHVGSLMRVIGE
jgi:homoserine dehydrogenase